MAQFAVEIADEHVDRVLNAVAANYNRQAQILNPDYDESATIPNPDYDSSLPEDPETNPSTIPDPSQVEFIDNPETIAQFANRMVRQFLSDHVQAYEIRLAKQQASDALDTTVVISNPHLQV